MHNLSTITKALRTKSRYVTICLPQICATMCVISVYLSIHSLLIQPPLYYVQPPDTTGLVIKHPLCVLISLTDPHREARGLLSVFVIHLKIVDTIEQVFVLAKAPSMSRKTTKAISYKAIACSILLTTLEELYRKTKC